MKTTVLVIAVAGLLTGCAASGETIDQARAPSERGKSVMKTIVPSRTLSVSIRCSPDRVYTFVANPENLPKWAQGLGGSVTKQGDGWRVDTPRGPLTIRFAADNSFGVLDHYVTAPSGVEIYVPMRVVANGSGSELVFTLFRQPDMSDQQYAEDLKLVEHDLTTLKEILERE